MAASTAKKVGLIVNPVAGLGGRVGLKGSDGPEIQQKARALGAEPEAPRRARQALEKLQPLQAEIELITYPGEMGAEPARASGFEPTVIGAIEPGETTPTDTRQAAQEMRDQRIDLLLFAGGDGTARDIYEAIGTDIPALGIPAGVKIHSAVYAANPNSAGELAARYLQDQITEVRESEVIDLDEEAFRQGSVATRLYGYLRVPFESSFVQTLKSPSPAGGSEALEGIAEHVIDRMEKDWLYIIGPGTTTRVITDQLGLEKTLLGVDVIKNRTLVATDANEAELLELIQDQPAKIIVTLIGGQGYIFGRGNQQISPAVIKKVGKENIIVISAPEKLYTLDGRPLRIDTGDPDVDEMLSGYVQVVVGYHHTKVQKVV
jgi:predicted polyphosphate/ATP-dependent NAD kinase